MMVTRAVFCLPLGLAIGAVYCSGKLFSTADRSPSMSTFEAGAVRIRTLKRRFVCWPEAPLPPELFRDLEMAHRLYQTLSLRVAAPFWEL